MKKKLIEAMIAMMLMGGAAQADCEWKSGVTPTYGGYLYSNDCHMKVGETVRDLGNAQITIGELNKAIKLKDDALLQSDERIERWKTAAGKIEDRLNQVQKLERRNMWIYFGVGVLATGLAVYGAHKL